MKQRRILIWAGATTAIVIYLLVAFLLNALPQSAFYNLAECPIPGDGERVLVFTPHPDDESIAIGGYIFSSRAAGAQVQVILATDGNHLGLRDQRYQEFKNATGKLNILPDELQFWGYPDGKLSDHFNELEPQVEKEIELYKPEYVIYPHPEDRHPDHATLGRAVEAALADEGQAGQNIKAYAYLIHFKYYPEPKILTRQHYLLPPVAVSKHNEVWNKVTLTAEAETAKDEAIHQYRTQLRNPFLIPLITGLMRNNELLVSRVIQPVQQI
jgi:N-acetylglucosamine malate deacetylase 1